MITSLIEMLNLPNLGHMTTFAIQFKLHDKILLKLWRYDKVMKSLPWFQNDFILRGPGVASLADIIKIATMFIKEVFKDAK